MSDLPDAPWIVESWYTGNDPDYEETPYERCSEDDFLEGADCWYGWRILAWELDTDEGIVGDESAWQDIWTALSLPVRGKLCKAYQKWNRDEAAEMYNDYWKEWRA